MTKEDYLEHRDDINMCFQIYLAIKGYRQPSPSVMRVIQVNLSPVKLQSFLDEHFQVNYMLQNQEGELIKLW